MRSDEADPELERILREPDSLVPALQRLEVTITGETLIEEAQEKQRVWQDVGLFYKNHGRFYESIAVFRIGVREVSEFINKLVMQDGRGGILFSRQGITGDEVNRYARLEVLKAYYRAGRIVMVLSCRRF